MPCDTIQTITVEFGKNTDKGALEAALMALDIRGAYLAEDGTLTLSEGRNRIQEIRREYSKQVVVSQAMKFGFKVAPLSEGKKGVNHVRV